MNKLRFFSQSSPFQDNIKNREKNMNNNNDMDYKIPTKIQPSSPLDVFHSQDDCSEVISRAYYEKRQLSLSSYQREKRSPSTSPITKKLFSFHRKLKRVPSFKIFRILVLGDPGVGKTSFIQRFVCGEFSTEYIPTVSETYETGLFVDIDDQLKQFDLEIRDFSGDIKENYLEVYENQIMEADGYVVVYSKDNPESLASVVETVADINIIKHNPSVLVLENKTDLKNSIVSDIVPRFQLINCRHMEVSALTNGGITEAITSLIYDMEEMSSLVLKP